MRSCRRTWRGAGAPRPRALFLPLTWPRPLTATPAARRCAAAHRAVAELLSNEKLKTALTKHIQNTDKTPLKRGMLVDYHIEPENLKSKAYWEPNCKVLETDPDFTGDSSGKTVLICKPNGHPFRVARHKLRPSNQANCVQLKAIDLEKSDWEIAKVFLERNEPETAQNDENEPETALNDENEPEEFLESSQSSKGQAPLLGVSAHYLSTTFLDEIKSADLNLDKVTVNDLEPNLR